MEALEAVQGAARQAANTFLQSKVRLGTIHTTPTEQLTSFLSMEPQVREHVREQLGEEAYRAWAQQQLRTLAGKKGVGPQGAAALFDMLGIFEPPTAAVPEGELTTAEPPIETEEPEDVEAEPETGEPELVL